MNDHDLTNDAAIPSNDRALTDPQLDLDFDDLLDEDIIDDDDDLDERSCA